MGHREPLTSTYPPSPRPRPVWKWPWYQRTWSVWVNSAGYQTYRLYKTLHSTSNTRKSFVFATMITFWQQFIDRSSMLCSLGNNYCYLLIIIAFKTDFMVLVLRSIVWMPSSVEQMRASTLLQMHSRTVEQMRTSTLLQMLSCRVKQMHASTLLQMHNRIVEQMGAPTLPQMHSHTAGLDAGTVAKNQHL